MSSQFQFNTTMAETKYILWGKYTGRVGSVMDPDPVLDRVGRFRNKLSDSGSYYFTQKLARLKLVFFILNNGHSRR